MQQTDLQFSMKYKCGVYCTHISLALPPAESLYHSTGREVEAESAGAFHYTRAPLSVHAMLVEAPVEKKTLKKH